MLRELNIFIDSLCLNLESFFGKIITLYENSFMYMIKFSTIFILMLILVSNIYAQNEKKVAVLDPAGNLPESIKTMIREELNNNVIRSKQFIAVERNLINKTVAESNYYITGQVDNKTVSDLGMLMGADLICYTTATTLGPNYYISCKIIDVAKVAVIGENTGITQEGLSDLFKVVSIIGNSFFPNQEIVNNSTPQEVTSPVIVPDAKPIERNSVASNLASIYFMGRQIFIMPYDVSYDKLTWHDANNICNNANANGFSDWRLPSKDEIAQLYLNKQVVNNVKPYWYWSSTSDGGDYYRQAFDADKLVLAAPEAKLYARCIRSDKGNLMSSNPIINIMGREIIVMANDVLQDRVNWIEANKACLTTNADGFDDWRLPAKDEISQMYFNKGMIRGMKPYWYWSSTSSGDEFYRQAFDANKLTPASQEARMHVRCVRGGQTNKKIVIPSINISGSDVNIMPSDIVEEKVSWEEANNACSNANAYGFNDWRLPTKDEIVQLYLNKGMIERVKPYWYWSATKGDKGYFRQAFDANKLEEAKLKDVSNVRCIRTNK